MNSIKENNILHLVLFGSEFRIWRHLLFILAGAIITFNQVFIAYQDCQQVLGNSIWLICFSAFLLYLTAMYFNYFFLTPRFLLEGKYLTYTVILCVIVFLLPMLSVAGEYWIRNAFNLPHRITSYTSPLILVDNLSASVITAVCFCGISVIVLFRKWMIGNEQIAILEGENIRSELNKLKGRIAPSFLSKTLCSASASAESEPQKTSGMLMQLGQVLRYQLYDAARDRILLRSEINSLIKFIELERSINHGIEYHIDVEGDMNGVFVSPMLFISFAQCLISDTTSLDLSLHVENQFLTFTGRSHNKSPLDEEVFSEIRQRLELQYPDRHTLTISPEGVKLKIALIS